jgi:hypothetical protein
MALFTDGNISALADLRTYESAILDLAGAEGIDAVAKLEVAQREIGIELTPFLVQRGVTTAQRDLSCVVVTEPLAHAHALRTLALIYRDAYQSQLSDRYEGKWRAYVKLAQEAMRKLFDHGVGVLCCPLPRPAAPVLSTLYSGLLPARTLSVRIAWAGGGDTSAPSQPESWQMGPGTRAVLRAPKAPKRAAGWLVYAGAAEQSCSLQTETPLATDQVWTEPSTGLRTDLMPWPEQGPDFFVVNRREWMRG